ncbi:MAG: hypothetical protein LBM09_01665 [Candidatus Nomurabacteria bacterium]|jgi:hypothetical protein|nr:hypothetical protein [Candidatus Nomurabacteria bacterium]
MREPNDLAKQFALELRFIRKLQQDDATKMQAAEMLHVSTTGAIITGLYENIRKASEDTEKNLILTRAIKRFFKRFYLAPNAAIKSIGEELVIELTLAGYLKNDSVPLETVENINKIAHDYSLARKKLMAKFPHETVESWVLEPMSVAIGMQLVDYRINTAFVDFTYNYFLKSIDVANLFANNPIASYEAALFMAVQKALLNSDSASVRFSLISRYQISPLKTVDFAKVNTQIDQILASSNFDKLSHIIDRNGAPFRILEQKLTDENLPDALESEKSFRGIFNKATTESYISIKKDINRGIVRSVVLISVARLLVFLATEVPYNLINYNSSRWLPLIVNLCSPTVYMFALRFTLAMPGPNNSRSLDKEITRILFDPVPSKPFIGSGAKRKFSPIYGIVYTIVILAILSGIIYCLLTFVRFTWLDVVKLAFFLSTASFLGFRLSRNIRNIETGEESQNGLTIVRDFFYMPFVVVGRKINEIYSKFNIVSKLLDMLIELPLKTLLGVIRRWGSFISYKKDSF